MAGEGSRFTKYGFKTNKYMLPIDKNHTSMIELAILSLGVPKNDSHFDFIFILRDDEDGMISQTLSNICTKAQYRFRIKSVNHLTEGPACTVFECMDMIDPRNELIVSNSDQVLDWKFDEFLDFSRNYDGCVLTYKPSYELVVGAQDKHSFIKKDENGKISDIAEKTVLSDTALVGVHYFKHAMYFRDAYLHLRKNDIRAPNGEFYLSLTYKPLLQKGKSVGFYLINQVDEVFYPVGEPLDYFQFLYSKGGYRKFIKPVADADANANIADLSRDMVNLRRFSQHECFANSDNDIMLIAAGSIKGIDKKYDILLLDNITFQEDSDVILVKNMEECEKGTYSSLDFTRGWFIGNFKPTLFERKDIEVGLLRHSKGEKWDFHYHSKADEINILVQGKMILNGIQIGPGTIFVIYKNEIACPIFEEDCKIVCIKVPSVQKDKTII